MARERCYVDMVEEAAEMARQHLRYSAQQGISGPGRLYYKPEHFCVQLEACPYDLKRDGWIPTDKFMPADIPYSAIFQWIWENGANVPIYAGR